VPVADLVREVPELPEGWLPDPTLILAVSKFDPAEELWEVVLPAFTIVGRGATFGDALSEAGELLEDYLRMSAAEGRSFEESRRPIRFSWMASLVGRAAASALDQRLRRGATRRSRVLHFPVGHAPC
jgi:hypothetical protein